MRRLGVVTMVVCSALCAVVAAAQAPQAPPAPQGRGGGRGGPAVVSPQIEADRRVTFRIRAPNATSVTVGGAVTGSLVPDPNAPAPQPAPAGPPAGRGGATPVVSMTKGENGVWAGTTVRPVRPGAWRYTFNIDGVTVVDPRNVHVTTSQTQVQSLLVVPGDFSETRDVPHGTVGAVRYVAKTLAKPRKTVRIDTRDIFAWTRSACHVCAGRVEPIGTVHCGR
jgi:enterochelin esterase family protein